MSNEQERPKCLKFNLKQVIGRNGVVIMSMLDRLLEHTSISATDVESGQTLLEHACKTNNISLAKLCYRRGAPLTDFASSGETPFNIATLNKAYRLMDCLRMYGVRVNSSDIEGRTALHIAASQNDLDGVCRLIEWGAQINARDNHHKTPLHYTSIAGHVEMSLFLLELGADLNAVDDREYTPVAHAECNDHFELMDRLVLLGGRGHRLQENVSSVDPAPINYMDDPQLLKTNRFKAPMGEVRISPLYLRKNSSLNRLVEHDPFLGIVLVARQLSTQARTIFQYPAMDSGVCPDTLFGIGCTEFGKFAMPAQWLMNRKLEFEIEVCGPSISARMTGCTAVNSFDHLRFVSFPCDCVGAPLRDERISAMTAFNIVFVFHSLRISDDEAELYWQALATISRAIIAEELRAGYLSLQVHEIIQSSTSSSLVAMLKSVYHGLCSNDRGISLYVNDAILTHITVNPFSEAPLPPAGHQSLLLTCNPDTLQAALPVDSASNIRRVIDAADPTKPLKEHMVELGLPISTIQRISQHLVYWKKAKIVHPLNKRSVLVINPVASGGIQLTRSVHSQLNLQFNLKSDSAYYKILYQFSNGKKLAEVKEIIVEEVPVLQNRFNELCVFLLSREILSYSMPYFRYFPPAGTRMVAKKPRPKFQNLLPHEIRCQFSPLEFEVIFERLRNNSTGSELMIRLISNYVKKHRDIMTARVELNEQFRCTNDDFHKFTEALSEGYLDSLLVKYECDQ